MSATRVSLRFLRAFVLRDCNAAWRATPYSQFPTSSRGWTDPALRTRTRKVAWNASSASARFGSKRRQTPQTIGPCRRTRVANATSSRRSTNEPSNCPSVGPARSGGMTARRWLRRTPLTLSVVMALSRRREAGCRPPTTSYLPDTRGLIRGFLQPAAWVILPARRAVVWSPHRDEETGRQSRQETRRGDGAVGWKTPSGGAI